MINMNENPSRSMTKRGFSDKLDIMNQKVLETLEFNKITDFLAECASSELAKKACHKLKPMDNLRDIQIAQQETEDALKRLLSNGNISFFGNETVKNAISRSEKESVLSAAELLTVARLLENTSRVKSYGKRGEDVERDSLDDYFEVLYPMENLLKDIRRCIVDEDEISDDASSNLRSIRRQKKSVNDKIHTQLSKMVSDTYRTYLQDSVITMRDGRYCIPVKAEYKSSVPGMIHDQSSSASTFFIEPAAIVNLNNDLRQLDIEEEKEIQVILTTLSEKCSDEAHLLKNNLNYLVKLDFIFAKGSLAIKQKATRPEYNDKHYINLKKARHPLLDAKKVVPIDISLGDNYDLLVITGPNTGGKTVSLKTIGLLTIMGEAGLHIPASDHSELSVFKEVYSDIGDEQSIEQSLSTFSSHMKRIVYILKHADEDSLCLFDELGAGTDPTEGAALAISILSTLHEQHIRCVATTHYSELKIFALREQGVENASCEFDVESLRPTYRLMIGIPGKSNAFAISKRLGLKSDIIERAKDQLDKQDESFEDVISSLEKNRKTLEDEQRQIEKYRHDIEALKNTYEQRNTKLDESREKILEKARQEADEILREAKETADTAIRNIQKYGSDVANLKAMEKERQGLGQKIKSNSSEIRSQIKVPSKTYKASDFKLGESVRIVSMNLTGTVNTVPDAKGNLFVMCGIMRTKTNINDLEILQTDDILGPGMSKAVRKGATVSRSGGLSKAASISAEIKLLGMTVDEALAALDKYLDDAYLASLPSVRVVHGKGTGALRNAVNAHLKKSSYVKSFHLAEYGEGDAGVTIVEFK